MARQLPANRFEFGMDVDGPDHERLQRLMEDARLDLIAEDAVAYKNKVAAKLMGDVADAAYSTFHTTAVDILEFQQQSTKAASSDTSLMAKQTISTLRSDLGGLQKVADYHLTELANRSVHPGPRQPKSALRRFWENY